MIALVKMSLKLLLRNKGFLFFLIVTPILSTVILSIKMDHTVYSDNSDKELVVELSDYVEKAVYVGDTSACIIKVYDASNSELSEYVLNQMAGTGMFSVCRADVSGLPEEEIEEAAVLSECISVVGIVHAHLVVAKKQQESASKPFLQLVTASFISVFANSHHSFSV